MNKKVMALAVAGALAAPGAALAQVTIGGGLHYQYFQHDSGIDVRKKTDVLNSSEPEIYFRAEEKLGGGLSTWLQCTSSFDVIGVGASSTTGGAGWCGRNSAVGFRGDFGNAFIGTWDTPQKLVVNLARGWWGGTNTLQGGSLVLLGNGSDSNLPNTGFSFFRRHQRSINYHSPNWGGFSVQAATSAANEATAFTSGSPLKPRLMSLAGQFRTGPFFAGVGYEQHGDFNLIPGDDTNFTVSVGFTIAGVARISGLYMQNEYDPTTKSLATPGVKDGGYAVYLDWTIAGPHKLYVQWALRPNTDVDIGTGSVEAPSTEAQVMGIAYGYSLSKRTQLYVAWNEMSNDPNANFTFGTTAGSFGGKQKAIGVGMRHSF